MINLSQLITNDGLRGVVFPGIIKNGRYFLTQFTLFEDGIIDCWGCVDLGLFEEKLNTQWVVPSFPDGNFAGLSRTGDMQILDAKWANYSKRAHYNYVRSILEQMNPTLENIFDMQGSETRQDEETGAKYAKVSRRASHRLKPAHKPSDPILKSETLNHLWQDGQDFRYVESVIFEDRTVVTYGMGTPREQSWAQFTELFEQNAPFASPDPGDRVVIEGLVTFKAGEVGWFKPKNDIYDEYNDVLDTLKGEPSRIQICVQSFATYTENPTPETLEALRLAYENVPESQQVFCGDQDVKDTPIRIALYGDKEIENWSHWQVSKSQGETPPTINVPKIKNQDCK